MFRTMTASFSRLLAIVLFLLSSAAFAQAGGAKRNAVNTAQTEEAERQSVKIAEPFLAALRAGDSQEAGRYISSAAIDEIEVQFADDQKKLAKAPPLTKRYVSVHLVPAYQKTGAEAEATLVYAAKEAGEKGKWTTVNLRAYRYGDGPFEIEDWSVNNDAPVEPVPRNIENFDFKKDPEFTKMLPNIAIALVIFGLLGVLFVIGLVFFIRRRPQLVSPAAEVDDRPAAATVQD